MQTSNISMIVCVYLLLFIASLVAAQQNQGQKPKSPPDPRKQAASKLTRTALGEYTEDGSMGIIVDQKEVREKLNYSKEQFDALEVIKDETDEKVVAMRQRFMEIIDLPEPQQQAAMERLRKELVPEIERLRAETRKKMEGIIGPEMVAQSKTLVFQASGGLSCPTVTTDSFIHFDLTEQQKERIRALARQSRDVYREITKGVDLRDPVQLADVEPRIEQLRKKNATLLQTILTDSQWKEAERLTEEGKPLYESIRKRATAPRTTAATVKPVSESTGQPWMPGPDSWKPGNPIPQKNGNAESPSPKKRDFPKAE